MVKMKVCYWLLIVLVWGTPLRAIEVHVDAARGHRAISPYLYGKNNCLSDNSKRPLSASQWQFLREVGVRMVRESGGNNSTKYNWVLKLSSHPDWPDVPWTFIWKL